MRTRIALLALVLLALALAGCGGDGGDDDAPGDGASSIGAEGGRVEAAGGAVRLDIPAGALDKPVAIHISDGKVADLPAGLRDNAEITRVVRLEPDGLQFAKPVRISLALPKGAVTADGVELGQRVLLSRSGGRYDLPRAQQQSVDLDSGVVTVSGEITHFSEVWDNLPKEAKVRVVFSGIPTEWEVGPSFFPKVEVTRGEGAALPLDSFEYKDRSTRVIVWKQTGATKASLLPGSSPQLTLEHYCEAAGTGSYAATLVFNIREALGSSEETESAFWLLSLGTVSPEIAKAVREGGWTRESRVDRKITCRERGAARQPTLTATTSASPTPPPTAPPGATPPPTAPAGAQPPPTAPAGAQPPPTAPPGAQPPPRPQVSDASLRGAQLTDQMYAALVPCPYTYTAQASPNVAQGVSSSPEMTAALQASAAHGFYSSVRTTAACAPFTAQSLVLTGDAAAMQQLYDTYVRVYPTLFTGVAAVGGLPGWQRSYCQDGIFANSTRYLFCVVSDGGTFVAHVAIGYPPANQVPAGRSNDLAREKRTLDGIYLPVILR